MKKSTKAEVVQTTSCLVVEQLVGGPYLALPALARCGEEDLPDQMDEFYAGEVLKLLQTVF